MLGGKAEARVPRGCGAGREGDRMMIRPLVPGDVPAIAALCEQREARTWCGEGWSEAGLDHLSPEELAYVAVEDGEMQACVQFRLGGTFGRSGAVTRLIVRGGRRGTGAVRRILEHTEEMILSRSRDLFLLCGSKEADARTFFEAMGYRECGRLEDYLRPGEAQVIYRKSAGADGRR